MNQSRLVQSLKLVILKKTHLLTQNQINFIMKKKIKDECYFFLPLCRVTMTTKNSLKWAFLQHPSYI